LLNKLVSEKWKKSFEEPRAWESTKWLLTIEAAIFVKKAFSFSSSNFFNSIYRTPTQFSRRLKGKKNSSSYPKNDQKISQSTPRIFLRGAKML